VAAAEARAESSAGAFTLPSSEAIAVFPQLTALSALHVSNSAPGR